MLPQAASEYWLGQQKVSAATLAVVKRLWRRMGRDFDASWDVMSPALVALIEQAQMSSAVMAKDFVPAVLGEQNLDIDPLAEVDPSRFTGVTGGGVPLEHALYASVVQAKTGVAKGMGFDAALQLGGSYLEMLTRTVLSDTGRAVESVGIAARPSVGYVRMLNPPSCSRCVILAGRFYRYSAGFRRHPGCDCRHIASTKSVAADISVDPTRYFDSLTAAEQDKAFTKAGAQAIRDGADMSQVVNASKGMQRAQVYGRELAYTTEGTTKRGVAGKVIRARGRNPVTTPRLMPDAIYQIAESRADALRLLRINGYVLDRSGPVSGVGSRVSLVPRVVDLDRVQADMVRVADRVTVVAPVNPPRPKLDRVTPVTVGRVKKAQLDDNEAELVAAAARMNVPAESLVTKANEGLQLFARDKQIAVNMKDDALLSFLSDRRYKTQYETGSSNALFDPVLRANYEQAWFGMGSPVPLYGYLRAPDGRTSGADAYGRTALILKDTVRKDMTVTVGDSLGRSASTVPGRLDAPGRFTAAPVQTSTFSTAAEYAKHLDTTHYATNYVEAQLRRAVTVDDVAEVAFRDAPSAEVAAALDTAGIRHSVVKAQPPAKRKRGLF